MNCEVFREHLDTFVDGELPDKESSKMYDHLQSCEDCASRIEDYERVDSILSEYRISGPPVSLKNGVMEELTDTNEHDQTISPAEDRTGGRTRGRLAVAAVFLVGMLLGLTVQILMFQTGPFGTSPRSSIKQQSKEVFTVRPTGSVSELFTRQSQQRTGGKP